MDPLANLNDISEPAAVSIWPLAVGWWIAITLLLLSIVVVWVLIIKRVRRNAARNAAIAELSSQYESNSLSVASANALLKRVCLSYCDRYSIASLYGEAWLRVLHKALSNSSNNDKLKEQLAIFESSLYQKPYEKPNDESDGKNTNIKPQLLFNITLSWLKKANFDQLTSTHTEAEHV